MIELAPAPAQATKAAPVTIAEWKASIAEANDRLAAAGQALAKQTRVTATEERIAGVRVYRLMPLEIAPEHTRHLFVHLHGGAFIKGAGLAALPEAVELAAFLKMPVLSIDYRMAPDHPAPAAMNDVIAAWREIVRRHPARTTVLGGTSAGANLALVATLRMKDLHIPLPSALFVGTPAADLAKRGDSRFINDGIDRNLVSWDAEPARAIALYTRENKLEDPYLSPIYGDFTGFPPTYLISGTRDLMLSDTVRVHRKLRQAGVEADLHVFEGMAHAEYVSLLGTPESAEHYAELNAFVLKHLGR